MSKKPRGPSHTPKDSHYARLRRQHREETRSSDPAPDDGRTFIYGLHTVRAALANPRRKILGLHVSENALSRLEIADTAALPFPVDITHPRNLDVLVGSDAVHQGAVLDVEPLASKTLEQLGDATLVVVLDQVTDPHNVGALMRSAVAFSASALITTNRHSPRESGVLAKTASGALEHIDLINVRNLANALIELKSRGFHTVGLDSEGPDILENTLAGPKIALVLGAEGKGLRQKTRETVNALARLDMPGPIKSLNVSNAAALSLYCARQVLAQSGPNTD